VHKAEADAKSLREKVGERNQQVFDDAKEKLEKGYRSSKSEVEHEIGHEKRELAKQLEVLSPANEKKEEVGGLEWRWQSAFGGFGGLGLKASY
jgi:hypothetical protein